MNVLPGVRRALVTALSMLAMASASAQTFPSKPIRIILPFPPGGSTDVCARLIAAKLAEDLKQAVYVESKPGAGTTIGAAFAAASPPDGHTLYITGPISHASSQALYKKLPYDALASFVPIGQISTSPFVIVVQPDSPAKTLPELLALARSEPGKMTYASSGNGAAPHLATEIIAEATGVSFTHVPFKGIGPAMVALLGAQVDFMIADVAVLPLIKSGKLRALAVTTADTSTTTLPGVPVLSNAGVPGVDIPSRLAMFAPAGTPRDVIERINTSMNRALNSAEVKKVFAAQGFETMPGTPDDLAKFMAGEVQRYGQIVRQLHISID